MTLRIKIDELLAKAKTSNFPLFCSAVLHTPASCLDDATFDSQGEYHIGTIRSRRFPHRRFTFYPEHILPKILISELITH